MRLRTWLMAVVFGILGAACSNAGEDRVLAITGTGSVSGLVFFDANRNLDPDASDIALEDVTVELLSAAGDVVTTAISDAQGLFAMAAVPVGSYAVAVDETTIGDTVEVARIDTSDITVVTDQDESVSIAIAFPAATIAEAKGLPIGTSVFLEGLALNSFFSFGDQTIHLLGSTGTIRLTRVAFVPIAAGDSIRARGKVNTTDGQVVLDNVQSFFLATVVTQPEPDNLTTVEAASAQAGVLDAALVQVVGATVSDSATVAGDFELTVNDGSGALIVRLDGDINFDTTGITPIPGAIIDVTGVLVPTGAGDWVLKPRGNGDITVQ